MAKSNRATRVKVNRQALRSRVFRPVEDARTERLSAKLLELAAQPKPREAEQMEIEKAAATDKIIEDIAVNGNDDDDDDVDAAMDVDEAPNKEQKKKANTTGKTAGKKGVRVQKKRRGKAAATMTFPKPGKQNRRVTSGRRKR